MIHPKELRLWNIVQRSPNTKELIIVELLHFTVKVICYDEIPAQVETWTELSYREIHPIPLTEKWMSKLQFSHKKILDTDGIGGVRVINSIHQEFSKQGLKLSFEGNMEAETNIRYVHQLQNLFYVLTGQELQLNK